MGEEGREKNITFMDSPAAKTLAGLAILRAAGAAYTLVKLLIDLVRVLIHIASFQDTVSYGFEVGLRAVLIYLCVLYILIGAGAALLLRKKYAGAHLCRKAYTHMRFVLIVLMFLTNVLLLFILYDGVSLAITIFIDTFFVLLILATGNLRRAMEDISYEIYGYNAEYCTTRALTGQMLTLGILAMADLCYNGRLTIVGIYFNLCDIHLPEESAFWFFGEYILAAMFFPAAFANTALRKHIRQKYLCKQEEKSYTPPFRPFTDVFGGLITGFPAAEALYELAVFLYWLPSSSGLFERSDYFIPVMAGYVIAPIGLGLLTFSFVSVKRDALTLAGGLALTVGCMIYLVVYFINTLGTYEALRLEATALWYFALAVAALVGLVRARGPEPKSIPMFLRILLLVPAAASALMPQFFASLDAYSALHSDLSLLSSLLLIRSVGRAPKQLA